MRPAIVAVWLAALMGSAAAQHVTAVLNADMRSSNPGVNRDDNTDAVMMHLVEGLVGYDEGGSVGPLLAEKVELSPDGRSYTFILRKGVKFHNGAELTSADVLWSWNRYMDPKTAWRCTGDFNGSSGLKVVSATAPDAGTFVMELSAPNTLFLDTLARTDCGMTAIVHKDSVRADGSWDKPIGTGPFMLGEWKRSQSIQLLAFPGYASPKGDKRDGLLGSKRPLVREARFMVIPDAATVKAGLMAGSLDLASVSESDVADLKASPRLTIEIGTTPARHSLIMQTRDPVLKNVKLRQAIAASIDFPELVANVTNDLGKPNSSPIYLTSKYFGEAEKRGFKYDPALAKRLLQEAGYKGEKITIIANKRSTVPSFGTAVIAQQMMQAAGINAEIEVLEWATQLDRYNKGNYQIQAFTYSSRFDPALGFEQIAGPKDKQPRKVWEDPEALALIDRSMIVADVAERQKIFDELHKRFIEQVPSIFTHNDIDIIAHSKRISGVTPWMSKLRLWEVSVTD